MVAIAETRRLLTARVRGKDARKVLRLLMRDLRTRRQRRLRIRPGCRGAIAERVDVRITSGAQVFADNEAVDAVGLEPVEGSQHSRRANASRPDDEVRCELRTARAMKRASRDACDLNAGAHVDALRGKRRRNGVGKLLRQIRQDARSRLDQRDPDVPVGIEIAKTVAREDARGVSQLRRELDTGCACADDGRYPAACRSAEADDSRRSKH